MRKKQFTELIPWWDEESAIIINHVCNIYLTSLMAESMLGDIMLEYHFLKTLHLKSWTPYAKLNKTFYKGFPNLSSNNFKVD